MIHTDEIGNRNESLEYRAIRDKYYEKERLMSRNLWRGYFATFGLGIIISAVTYVGKDQKFKQSDEHIRQYVGARATVKELQTERHNVLGQMPKFSYHSKASEEFINEAYGAQKRKLDALNKAISDIGSEALSLGATNKAVANYIEFNDKYSKSFALGSLGMIFGGLLTLFAHKALSRKYSKERNKELEALASGI